MTRAAPAEKPSPLGDRVYKKHRKMLTAIAKKRGEKNAAALRYAIESTHERVVLGKES